jgi:hypothetical protein
MRSGSHVQHCGTGTLGCRHPCHLVIIDQWNSQQCAVAIKFWVDFLHFCWAFQKFPFFCVTLYNTRSGIFYCDWFHCRKVSNFGLIQIWDVKHIISSLTFELQLKTFFFKCRSCVLCNVLLLLLNKRLSYYTFYMMTAIIRAQARQSLVQISAGAREFPPKCSDQLLRPAQPLIQWVSVFSPHGIMQPVLRLSIRL